MEKNRLLSKPIAYLLFCFLGALFMFCLLTEGDLARQGNILWTQGYLVRTLGISLLAGGGLGAVICFCIYKWNVHGYVLEQRMAIERKGEVAGGKVIGDETFREKALGDGSADRLGVWLLGRTKGEYGWGKVFRVSMALSFCAWIPAFLAYFPAICAYDVVYQTGQIVENYYIDHHPIFHTLLIKCAMMLGENVLGSMNRGIGCYTLCQMLFLASAFAFGIAMLWRRNIRRIWLGLAQLFCMCYPFHWYMSVSMTKDTVFAAFFLIQLTALCEMMCGHKSKTGCEAMNDGKSKKSHKDVCKNIGMELLFFIATVGMVLFRNNGKYAFLVFIVFLAAAVLLGKKRRFWGRLLLWSLGALVTGVVLLQTVFQIMDAEQGDRREMLSIPIQQLARTMVYHGGVGVLAEDDNTMKEADKALVNDFILNEAYRNYRPDFADPVKSNTNTYVARFRAGEFIGTYLGLFLQYPGDFLNAALAVNAGYLYPGDISHAYINAQEGQAAGGGYVQTRWEEETLNSRGIYKASKWPGLFEVMEQWADENAYLTLPVLKYLFVPGVVIWLYLLLLGSRLVKREFGLCMPLLLVLGYFLTLLLGPTVQLRYIYPVMIAFPFLLLWPGKSCGLSQQSSVEITCSEGGEDDR